MTKPTWKVKTARHRHFYIQDMSEQTSKIKYKTKFKGKSLQLMSFQMNDSSKDLTCFFPQLIFLLLLYPFITLPKVGFRQYIQWPRHHIWEDNSKLEDIHSDMYKLLRHGELSQSEVKECTPTQSNVLLSLSGSIQSHNRDTDQ